MNKLFTRSKTVTVPPIQTNAPLRLPLEVIECILELALPPETLDPAYKNPRTQFLLRLGLVCRWLHLYAEPRLLEGMTTVERSLGMKRLRRCLRSSSGRGQKVQQLHLVLENDEKMWLVEPQQDKAVTALLAVCTGLKTLRLSCPDRGRSSVESTALAGVEHVESIELVNITVLQPKDGTPGHFSLLHPRRADPLALPWALRRLTLSNSNFTTDNALPNLTHLRSNGSFLSTPTLLTFEPPLRFVELDGDNTRTIVHLASRIHLSSQSSLVALGIPFDSLYDLLHVMPPSVRHLRLHSTRLLRLPEVNIGFALLIQALENQRASLPGLKTLILGAGGLQLLRLSEVEEMWERLQEAARRRGVEIICEPQKMLASLHENLAAEEEGARRFWELGLSL